MQRHTSWIQKRHTNGFFNGTRENTSHRGCSLHIKVSESHLVHSNFALQLHPLTFNVDPSTLNLHHSPSSLHPAAFNLCFGLQASNLQPPANELQTPTTNQQYPHMPDAETSCPSSPDVAIVLHPLFSNPRGLSRSNLPNMLFGLEPLLWLPPLVHIASLASTSL